MLDIDNTTLTESQLIEQFEKQKELSFKIYKSKRGFHVFCISKPFEYRNKDTVEYMLSQGSDPDYTRYCYIRGFCVRLNKKFNEGLKTDNYTLLCITNKEKKNINLENLVDLHYEFCQKYKNDININNIDLP